MLSMARSDADLAQAAGGGDGAAFAELYDRHGESVYSFCLRVVGSPHDAADATQETFLNVFLRLQDGGEPVRNVRAYLLTAARHASLRVIERKRRGGGSPDAGVEGASGAAGGGGPGVAGGL